MKLLRVTCFFILFAYLGIAGSFFGLIALAMRSTMLFVLYIILMIPLLAYHNKVFEFCFGWMKEKEDAA